jgi:hypothetical protein
MIRPRALRNLMVAGVNGDGRLEAFVRGNDGTVEPSARVNHTDYSAVGPADVREVTPGDGGDRIYGSRR